MGAKITQAAFTGGVFDPALSARIDLQKYASACKELENFIVQPHGGAYRRPGLGYISTALGKSKIIPFQFNVEQSYILIFSDQKMRVLMDGGTVLESAVNITNATQANPVQITVTGHGYSTGDEVYIEGVGGMTEINSKYFTITVVDANNFAIGVDGTGYAAYTSGGTSKRVYTISTPYAEADLFGLYYAQSADTMYICHPSYQVRKLTRTGHTSWTISTVSFGSGLSAPTGLTTTWNGTGGSYTIEYAVVAANDDGDESVAAEDSITTGLHPDDWATSNWVDLSWSAVTGADEYIIYKKKQGIYGYIGTARGVTSFRDDNFDSDLNDAVPEAYDPFTGTNYPGTVTFHQQRLFFGGSNEKPQTMWASRIGNFESFNKARPIRDDDSLEYTIVSNQVNDIRWVVANDDLLVGTAGIETRIFANDGALTPSTMQVKTQSRWGSVKLMPILIGNSVLHVQAQGAKVRDLFYTIERDGYSGNDLSILANHLFEGHEIVDWAYQASPDSVIWCVRDDGVVIALTYMKEHDIWGWHKHTTDGLFESVGVIPSTSYDDVYFIVNRGGTRFIEKMVDKWNGDDIKDAIFLDSYLTYDGSATTTITGLDHLEGETVQALADGSPVADLTVTNGSVTLPTAAEKIHVGLGYESILAPIGVELNTNEGTSLGRKKTFAKITLRLSSTVGGKVGPKTSKLISLKFTQEYYDQAIPPFSGDYDFIPQTGYDTDGSFYVKQDQPLPMTIIALIPDIVVSK